MKQNVSAAEAAEIIADSFSTLPDPRVVGRTTHNLLTVVGTALVATICGAQTFRDMAMYTSLNADFLQDFFEIKGTPSHHTYARVFSALNPAAFLGCLLIWTEKLSGKFTGRNISIDGKSIKGTRGDDKKLAHIVSAFWSDAGLVLAQEKVDEKSNEITSIPEVINSLNLQESDNISIDAMGTQKAIAEKINESSAGYVLSIKGNQPSLNNEVLMMIGDSDIKTLEQRASDSYSIIEKGHGRIDERSYHVFYNPKEITEIDNWPGAIGVGVAIRVDHASASSEQTRRFFLINKEFSAEKFGAIVRSHWGIENSLHHVLDVTFGEDACRGRTKNAAQNLTTIRKQAMTIIRAGTPKNRSYRAAIKSAGWSYDALCAILTQWAQKLDTCNKD